MLGVDDKIMTDDTHCFNCHFSLDDCVCDERHKRNPPEEDRDPFDIWCKCEPQGDSFYAHDNMCKCGIVKHHYHCYKCKKVTQIG